MKVLIAGDFVPQNRIVPLVNDGHFEVFLNEIKPITQSADYSIVNLEAPVIYGHPTPIKKNGPNLYCNEKALDAIKWAGFNCVTLANNHFYDQGEEGVKHTIQECKKRNIDHVGGGYDIKEASSVLYKEINGKSFAILNACEHEYSIATETHGGSNPFDEINLYYDIQEVKNKAEFIILIIHGGIENCQVPPMHLVKKLRFLADTGASAIICHHQHCFSGYEVYHNVPIFYGLGNFCFDELTSQANNWSQGYMVMLNFSEKNTSFNIYPYIQCAEKPVISLQEDDDCNVFLKRINEIQSIIVDINKLTNYLKNYYDATESQYNKITNIYPQNKLIQKLFQHGMLPNIFKARYWNLLRDVLLCESHAERFVHFVLNRTTNHK